ncbi:MAG: glycine zipper family protein [Pseudomonadota bacterium]
MEYRKFIYCSALLLCCACTTPLPTGPRVAVMPAPGKPFDLFAAEEYSCRQYAQQSLSATPDATAQNVAGSAVAGAAFGTVAGALLGGREGAPIGAGVGLIAGSAAGSNQAAYGARDAQWRYDTAYKQCMYAKGNQVPGYRMQPRVLPPPPN